MVVLLLFGCCNAFSLSYYNYPMYVYEYPSYNDVIELGYASSYEGSAAQPDFNQCGLSERLAKDDFMTNKDVYVMTMSDDRYEYDGSDSATTEDDERDATNATVVCKNLEGDTAIVCGTNDTSQGNGIEKFKKLAVEICDEK